VPVLSLGPFLDTDPFYDTPWRRGVRLVDEAGRPFLLDDVEPETFYTAYAEGAGKDVHLTIGNGYAQGHAKLALDLVRATPALQRIFGDRVA